VGLPARTEPGEAGRAKIENARIWRPTLRESQVLQRALYIYPRTNAEEAKRCGRGLTYFSTVILKLVQRRTMADTTKQLVDGVTKGMRRILAAQGTKCRIEFTESGMREMRFRCVAHFEMMQMTQRDVKLTKLG
jgi:hypothetical protein